MRVAAPPFNATTLSAGEMIGATRALTRLTTPLAEMRNS